MLKLVYQTPRVSTLNKNSSVLTETVTRAILMIFYEQVVMKWEQELSFRNGLFLRREQEKPRTYIVMWVLLVGLLIDYMYIMKVVDWRCYMLYVNLDQIANGIWPDRER